MPATVTTKELFPKKDVTRAQVEEEMRLRIKAGAIKSWIEEDTANWILCTEWNVIGQNE